MLKSEIMTSIIRVANPITPIDPTIPITEPEDTSGITILYPEDYGCGANGNTPAEEISYWADLLADAEDGNRIQCANGAVYNLVADTEPLINFDKALDIRATGATWLVGAFAQRGIRLVGADIRWTGGTISGSSEGYANEQTWRPFYVEADRVQIQNLAMINTAIGVNVQKSNAVSVSNCTFTNSTLRQGLGTYFYSAAVKLLGCTNSSVNSCTSSGFGQAILVGAKDGVPAADLVISRVSSYDTADNGIYISSGDRVKVTDCDITRFNSTGIKTDGNYHEVRNNTVRTKRETDDESLELENRTAIIVSGDGTPEEGIWNGEGTIVDSNTVYGNFFRGVYFAVRTGGYHRNAIVTNNTLTTTCTTAGRSPVVYSHESIEATTTYENNTESGW